MEVDEERNGKNTSSEGSARRRIEGDFAKRKMKPKISMLRSCCGLTKDQEYFLEAYTKGGLHYKVEGGKEYVDAA